MAPPIIVTEDTPPDMLAGSMDLTVVLPDRHSLKMSVDRSTPMMDLLVQVTTANKLPPASYIIHPLNQRGTLPYKPSTPIGALDAWTIHLVPKHLGHCGADKRHKQPFEQTFRLQVHLPRNQLFVARVSPNTRLSDILLQVCSEKNLDPIKYSLRHPGNLDQVLSLSCTLADYKLQELTLVYNRTHPVQVSTVDIMSLQRDPANPAYRNNKCEGSVSSGSLEGRSLSPVPSDESSASPPPLPPSRPTRKRRPAPKPPIQNHKIMLQKEETKVNHSRNSSDSSGYHEASVLSDSPQSNSSVAEVGCRVAEDKPALSQSMTDVSIIQRPLQQATSYTSLSSVTGRKKKAAPPPPVVEKTKVPLSVEDKPRTPSVSSTASSTTTLDGNEVIPTYKSATLPPSSRLNTVPHSPSPPSSTSVDVESPASTQGSETNLSDLRLADEEIDRIFANATESHNDDIESRERNHIQTLPSPVDSGTQSESVEPVWEYQLPAPPTFRDKTKSPTVTEFGTITLRSFSEDLSTTDNVVCDRSEVDNFSTRNDNQSENVTTKVDDITLINENNVPKIISQTSNVPEIIGFQDKKHTVCQKESDINVGIKQTVVNDLTSKLSEMKSLKKENIEIKKESHKQLSTSRTLDNFTISTYKDTKPVEVFEDDSIKSSTGEKRDKSKDDAVFRAPKPRVKEPNLLRTNSFSMENKLNGPVIKRSVSYVSLLAANMPRHSQPYRAHLSHFEGPPLRKTTSELSIDVKEHNLERSLWQSAENPPELQSVQVMRNILNLSQANLSVNTTEPQYRDSPVPVEESVNSSKGQTSWSRSLSEKQSLSASRWSSLNTFEHSVSLNEGNSYPSGVHKAPPSINLSTWSERPKQHISIKDDGDYRFGFGKKSSCQDETLNKDLHKNNLKVTENNDIRYKDEGLLNKPPTNYKLENRSKSISDLSRLPIVTAVELKKPKTMNSPSLINKDNALSLTTSEKSETNQERDCNSFIGVNSLARKFGVPNKRPLSMYGSATGINYLQTISKGDHSETNKKDSTYNRHICSTMSDNVSKAQDKIICPTEFTSEIKAQAKIRSGGFKEGEPDFTIVSRPQSNNSLTRLKSNSSANLESQNDNRRRTESFTNDPRMESNHVRITVNSAPIRQAQTLNRNIRPANLQPVVKGFTNVTINSTSSASVEISPKIDSFSVPPNIINTDLNRNGSATLLTTFQEPAKRVVSNTTLSKTTVAVPAPPPPPSLATSLRPANERKGIKFLPKPDANPRDLLMSSIRSFRKGDLKSSKYKPNLVLEKKT